MTYKRLTIGTAAAFCFIALIALQIILRAAPSTRVAFPDREGQPVEVSVLTNVVVSGDDVISEAADKEPESEMGVIVPLLINTEYTLPSDFVPENLVPIGASVKGTDTIKMNGTMFDAYKVMYEDMKEAPNTPIPQVLSAYRPYSYQKQLYDKKVAQYGPGQKVTAKPGTSEHQYSGCIDLSTDGTCQNNFNQLPTGKWIKENSYKYGFVVRFPENKKELTGINYEPWHIRYVGVAHATKMHDLDMCLEEYVEYLYQTYPVTLVETSPDNFKAPKFAGDMGDVEDLPMAAVDDWPEENREPQIKKYAKSTTSAAAQP